MCFHLWCECDCNKPLIWFIVGYFYTCVVRSLPFNFRGNEKSYTAPTHFFMNCTTQVKIKSHFHISIFRNVKIKTYQRQRVLPWHHVACCKNHVLFKDGARGHIKIQNNDWPAHSVWKSWLESLHQGVLDEDLCKCVGLSLY